jgi:hypothetical protein
MLREGFAQTILVRPRSPRCERMIPYLIDSSNTGRARVETSSTQTRTTAKSDTKQPIDGPLIGMTATSIGATTDTTEGKSRRANLVMRFELKAIRIAPSPTVGTDNARIARPRCKTTNLALRSDDVHAETIPTIIARCLNGTFEIDSTMRRTSRESAVHQRRRITTNGSPNEVVSTESTLEGQPTSGNTKDAKNVPTAVMAKTDDLQDASKILGVIAT